MFEARPDWYRAGEVRALVLAYYALLRVALGAKPHLRGCLTGCRECGIFFPTHPRNWGRCDLRCPFGCRQAHRKRCSTRRSVEYYRTAEGKVKKRIQNSKRKGRRKGSGASGKAKQSQREEASAVGYDAEMVEHIQMFTSELEGRQVSLEEVFDMLERAEKRQQGIGGEETSGYGARDSKDDTS